MKITAVRIAVAAATLAAMATPAAAESPLGSTRHGTHMSAGPDRAYEVNPSLSAAAAAGRND